MTAKKMTYKEALTELEEILQDIENEEPDIDKLTEKVKRASYLLRFCQKKLHNTSLEVAQVLKEMEDQQED